MLPVLFSFFNFTVSSFGVFLVLSFLAGIFIIWRLSRAWDLEEEKILDLVLITLAGALFGARLFFVLENLSFFIAVPLNIILINKVPGFTFWGGLSGGWLTLFYFARRLKVDFWQLADIALVGLLGGLILADLGCFLGACSIGTITQSFLGVPMTGFIGKRWPVQLFEAFLLFIVFRRVWSRAIHFHERGKIAALVLIYLGIIKLLLLPLRQDISSVFFVSGITVLGVTLFYRITKQNPLEHLKNLQKFLILLIISPSDRKMAIQKIFKYCYNQKTNILWKLRNFKKILRKINVKLS